MTIQWLFDSVCDSAMPAQILRHSRFIEALFDEYSTKNLCSFLTQFSDVSTFLCAKENFHMLAIIVNTNSSKQLLFTPGPDKVFLVLNYFQTMVYNDVALHCQMDM